MVQPAFLEKGLLALSRAYRAHPMAGHLGAAVAAGYFFSADHPTLDEEVHAGIEREVKRVIEGGEPAFNPRAGDEVTVAELFEPAHSETMSEDGTDNIAEALSHNIDKARESGHNTIFASIAIRAFEDHPERATRSIVDGIDRLIRRFDDASPGSGYYGEAKGRVDGNAVILTEEANFPPYEGLAAMAGTVMDELIERAAERRQGYGGLHHVINHAAALTELSRYGYGELAQRGLSAHHQHLRLWRTLPDLSDELGPEEPAAHDPMTPAFWRSLRDEPERARLTHRIKTLYGFSRLALLIDDGAKVKQAEEKLRYLLL